MSLASGTPFTTDSGYSIVVFVERDTGRIEDTNANPAIQHEHTERAIAMTTASYVDVLPTHAQISDRDQAVMLVIVDGEDGLLISQVESLFNLSQFEVRRVLAAAGLSHRKLTGSSLRTLQDEGLTSYQAGQATFVPRDSLRAVIEELGKDEDRKLYRMLWAPLKPKVERSMPQRTFRSSVVRSLRKLHEDRRLMRQEIDELRGIVEDLLHAEMSSMTMNLARKNVKAVDLAAMSNDDLG
ncbi:MAG TPA: hypothetical protein VE954_05830 [Oligoflexus sp.]|uniref:hypothetical protein n=1 Tax=Oligoflexus sp. TaxID=1971216 RepID=UPI002D23D0CC|nr:hypothetical protein [Oligoflexus sp.]HYX32612.1 hypothetical protein [Oligoflexus sp.]